MPSLKIVSSGEGLSLLRRNKMDGKFDKIICHYCDSADSPNKIMSYHSMFKELNNKKRQIPIAPVPGQKRESWYQSILFSNPVYYKRYFWTYTKTLGVSIHEALDLDAIRRKEHSGILVFAPQPLSAVIYRLYKQVLSTIDYDLSVVVVRTKLDKTLTSAYDYSSQINTLALNSLFGGYNAKRIIKFNGIYLNLRLILNPNNNCLTKDSCRLFTEAERNVYTPQKK